MRLRARGHSESGHSSQPAQPTSHLRLIVVASLALATACGGSSSTPASDTTPNPTGATAVPARSDAEKARLVQENIDLLYCGSAPVADWCKNLARGPDKKPLVQVDITSVFIATTLAATARGRQIARAICSAIAFAAFDEAGEPIGFYHVHVASANPDVFLADCDVAR